MPSIKMRNNSGFGSESRCTKIPPSFLMMNFGSIYSTLLADKVLSTFLTVSTAIETPSFETFGGVSVAVALLGGNVGEIPVSGSIFAD